MDAPETLTGGGKSVLALAVIEALEAAGFGQYGDTLWWDASPVLATGTVTAQEGVWVTATPGNVSDAFVYQTTIQVSARFLDTVRQGRVLIDLMNWVNRDLAGRCELTVTLGQTQPLVFPLTGVDPCQYPQLTAIDGEGRPVKQTSFTVHHKLPAN